MMARVIKSNLVLTSLRSAGTTYLRVAGHPVGLRRSGRAAPFLNVVPRSWVLRAVKLRDCPFLHSFIADSLGTVRIAKYYALRPEGQSEIDINSYTLSWRKTP